MARPVAGEMALSQVSFGGFDENVSAKELTDFLEYEIGMIWRCRVKNSRTPPNSYANHNVLDLSNIPRKNDCTKVAPHAFVHFATPDGARRAIDAAGRRELVLKGRPLKANSGTDSSFRVDRKRTADPFRFSGVRVDIGTPASGNKFLVAWKGPDSGVNFVIDPFDGRGRMVIPKETAFSFNDTNEMTVVKCDFKVEFLVRDISEIKLFTDGYPLVMLFRLASCAWVSYRTADDDIHLTCSFDPSDDEDPWIRTTDFTPGGAIGRCSWYRIALSPRYWREVERSFAFLNERGIAEQQPTRPIVVQDEPGYGAPLSEPFFCIHHKEGISFSTLFLVNALVHKGVVDQHQLSEDFFALLRNQSDAVNETALRRIWSYDAPIFDACKRLKLVQDWLLENPEFLIKRSRFSDDDEVEVRRLVITPTKAYCLPPELEVSNRVLRNYKDVADRFLRVAFRDEGMQPLNTNVLNYHVAPIVRELTSNSSPQKTTVFRRVRSILTEGFRLCGRKYSFLAFSSNQLRDRSAWFFAETGVTSAATIRGWMGKFAFRSVAKSAARMGQCLSSTYATVDVQPSQVNPSLPDIKRNGYIFSDGIGKMTPELAMEVAERLQLGENPPSAYQIRYAGCKGVVAVWPGDEDGIRLSLRPSMNKFASSHTTFEVVSWTRFQPGFLNRQIVTLLSSLKVPDGVFARMQDSMVSKLNQMLLDADVAYDVVASSCAAEQGNVAAMMLSAGFRPQAEPHLKGMLSCIRSAQLGDLLTKTRLFVPKGRWLMGCLDELGELEQGQCFIQSSVPPLEERFRKQDSRFYGRRISRQVILGTVVVAKNPCLHPGDIRILQAVDVPGLHHLVDCLVFPQNGDRPHANEASGSDLDGDMYFVTWDEDLIPPGRKSRDPLDYAPGKDKVQPRPVSSQDIVDFFLKNMVNENLGVICNAHVVHADRSETGALDEKCLELAKMAAIAVDFPKTGKQVTMPPDLKPKVYPDFMGKEDHLSYKSEKILGRLYRKIKDAIKDDVPSELLCSMEDLPPYDTDLDIPGASDYLADAWKNKCSYDGQLNALLGLYGIRSEGEVVTGHIWSFPRYSSRKQSELKERLRNAYSALHKEFRRIFESMGPHFQRLTDDQRSTSYEQKASAWYQVSYHPMWIKKSTEIKVPDEVSAPARLSFAWIAADYLARIKRRSQVRRKFGGKRPTMR